MARLSSLGATVDLMPRARAFSFSAAAFSLAIDSDVPAANGGSHLRVPSTSVIRARHLPSAVGWTVPFGLRPPLFVLLLLLSCDMSITHFG
jgi:hypothetical protein